MIDASEVGVGITLLYVAQFLEVLKLLPFSGRVGNIQIMRRACGNKNLRHLRNLREKYQIILRQGET